MKERLKRFFFSRFTLIALAALYVLFAGVSFMGEYFIGKTDLEYTAFLRITTLILDVIIIGAGIFTWIQVRLRKRIKKLVFRKRMTLILYLADTLAIFLLFFLPYVTRLLVLFFGHKISYYSLLIDTFMGIAVVITIGFLIKKVLRKIKRFGKRFKKRFKKK